MEKLTKEEYNDEPVYFCKDCLSLRIRDAGLEDLLYCDKCSSTHIGRTHINTWEKAFKAKHGFNYIEHK